jgi:hypothetical protein
MTNFDRALGLVLATAAAAGLSWASNVPMPAYHSRDAVLRLAWSARPERVEECHQRSEEELARLPPHMRQPFACEGTTAQYRLQVRIDGEIRTDRIVRGGGLRHDRRLYVFEELPIPTGQAAVDVRFDRVGHGQAGNVSERNGGMASAGSPGPAPRAESVPPHLAVTERLVVAPRAVILVTYSGEGRALVVVR